MKACLLAGSILLGMFFMSCSGGIRSNKPELKSERQSEEGIDQKIDPPSMDWEDLSFETYPVDEGFGYTISSKGVKMIVQDYIPCIQGKKAFRTKKEAKKVAKLMIEKFENNVIPPSITLDELLQLGIEIE